QGKHVELRNDLADLDHVDPSMIDWFLPTDLHHPRRLLLVRQAAVWGELIHQVGQMLAKAGEQIIHTQAGVFAQCVDGVAAERVRQIFWCDLVVRPVADPGLCDMAMPALLEFFYDVREPAAEHAASCGSAEQTAQSTGKDIAQAAAGLCAGT